MPDNYCYLVAGLPDLLLDGENGAPSYPDFADEIMEMVSDDDRKLFRHLRFRYDNNNLLGLMGELNSDFDPKGNYIEEELQYEFNAMDTIPGFMKDFIEAHGKSMPFYYNMSWEDQLNWLYYEEAGRIENSFLREWFEFDLNLRNLLAAINCRRFNIPLERRIETRLEQPAAQNIIGRNDVAEAILKSSAPDFSVSPIFPYVGELLELDPSNLAESEKRIDELRWNMLDEMTLFSHFQVETVLAYTIKLEIVTRWQGLSEEIGMEVFERLVGDLEESYSLPEEYNQVRGGV